jgi:hypothetical protein
MHARARKPVTAPQPQLHGQTARSRSFKKTALSLTRRFRTRHPGRGSAVPAELLTRRDQQPDSRHRPEGNALHAARQSDHAGDHQLQTAHSETGLADQHGELGQDIPGDEISGIHLYYAGLIAAVRGSMKGSDAKAMIRRLRNEKISAVRAAKARRCAARSNRRTPSRQPMKRANAPAAAFNI